MKMIKLTKLTESEKDTVTKLKIHTGAKTNSAAVKHGLAILSDIFKNSQNLKK